MAPNTTSWECYAYSGPNCSDGRPFWIDQCQKDFPLYRRGDPASCGGWANCVLTALSEYEKSMFSTRQLTLTLWPAIIGFICAFGPDPSDFVYDNFWWAVLFAVSCGALPGLDARKPRHFINVDWIGEGRRICENAPNSISPEYPELIPRSYGRPNTKRVEAVVRIEWASHIFSWLMWLGFNVTFAYSLGLSCCYTMEVKGGGGVWYWLSGLPALSCMIYEACQRRVDLYEPLKISDDSFSGKNPGSSSVQPPLRNLPKGDPAPTANAVGTTQQPLYQRVHPQNFFHLWTRIIYLQWTRGRYRVLVRPEDDRWQFLIMKLLISLIRIWIFAWGSSIMGGIILFPMPQDLALLVLLSFLTALPRMLFFNVWRNKARGADIVVICNQLAIGLTNQCGT